MSSVPAARDGGLRIIVAGCIVRCPFGGMAWHYLQYVLGLSQLGHDVHYMEDSGDYPSCYNPATHTTERDPTYGLDFTASLFERAGLPGRWAYFDRHGSGWRGPESSTAVEIARSADLLLNVSGANAVRDWHGRIPRRVFIDTDPGLVQIRHLTDPGRRDLAERHNGFFSFGENIAAGRSSVPDDGLAWRATRQPIVADSWPVEPGRPDARFTTVMQWASDRRPSVYQGERYGVKADSFADFVDLPGGTDQRLELALGSPSAPRDELRSRGWELRDPLEVSRDPWAYQAYIRDSKGEFSVAKQAYVKTRSGWFSERTACYLASGRPAVVQDTGFSDFLETGEGLLSFETPEEALAGIEEVAARYDFHCQRARSLAVETFDSGKVLGTLVEDAMHPAGGARVTPAGGRAPDVPDAHEPPPGEP